MSKEGIRARILNKFSWFGKIPEYNVLLLGETGTGKSTTINAWANYMRYKTFEEAKYGEFERMIPAKFNLPDPVTKEPIEIRCGLDDPQDNSKNEAFNEEGESVTQMPSSYTFKFKDRVLRIIDTPGVGDTRGGTVDRENIDQILAYLNNYKELHAIVILFKANQTRSTSSFRYCISELLNHLHKDATKNLIFCFTFSQNTNFKAGEGYHVVKSFLESDLPEVDVALKPGENCFFIDNESFRFLAAMKQDYPFDMRQDRIYRLSWDKSADQSNKMWDRITRESNPHNLTDTISLNNARKFILQMAEPLVRLQSTIEDNIHHIRAQEELLQTQTRNKADLERRLNMEVDSLVSEPLNHPRTVCTDAKCIELVDSGQGQAQVHYKTKCHPHCFLNDVGVNTPGHPLLRRCAAIGSAGICVVCGCRWEKHQHITLRFKIVKIPAFTENIKKNIESAKTQIEGIKAAIKAFDDIIVAFEEEYKVIQEVCSKFAYILVKNSTTPYNRFIEPYLDLQMEEEKAKIQANSNYPKDRLNSLKKMKHLHQERVEIIKKAIESNERPEIELKDIYEYKEQLLKLKLTGEQLGQMLEAASWSKNKEIEKIQEKGLDLTNFTVTISESSSSSTSVPTTVPSASNSANNRNNTDNNNNNDNKEGFWSQFWKI